MGGWVVLNSLFNFFDRKSATKVSVPPCLRYPGEIRESFVPDMSCIPLAFIDHHSVSPSSHWILDT